MGARGRPLPSGAGCLAPRIKLRDVILSGARPQLPPAVSELNPREVRIACPEQGRVSGRAERGPPVAECTLPARGLGAEGNRSRSGRQNLKRCTSPSQREGLARSANRSCLSLTQKRMSSREEPWERSLQRRTKDPPQPANANQPERPPRIRTRRPTPSENSVLYQGTVLYQGPTSVGPKKRRADLPCCRRPAIALR
jgi:hypothetical protein